MFGLDSRALRIIWTLAFCYLLYLLRGTILLVVLSIIAAYLLLPVVDFIYSKLTHHHHRGWALAAVYILIFALILSVGGLIGYYAFQQAIELAKEIPDMTQPSAVDHVHLPRFLARWDVPIRAHLKSWIELHGKDMLETITNLSMKLLTAASSIVLLLVVLVLSYLLLRNGRDLIESAIGALAPAHRSKARDILRDEHNFLKHWARSVVLSAILTAVLYGIGFSLLRVPYSVLLALMMFPFEFIPLLGPPAAFLIVLVIAAISNYHGFGWLILFFVLVRIFVDYLLQPYLFSSGEFELPPFIVIVSALAGEALAGVPGVLLSIPVSATILIFYRRLYGSAAHEHEAIGSPQQLSLHNAKRY